MNTRRLGCSGLTAFLLLALVDEGAVAPASTNDRKPDGADGFQAMMNDAVACWSCGAFARVAVYLLVRWQGAIPHLAPPDRNQRCAHASTRCEPKTDSVTAPKTDSVTAGADPSARRNRLTRALRLGLDKSRG